MSSRIKSKTLKTHFQSRWKVDVHDERMSFEIEIALFFSFVPSQESEMGEKTVDFKLTNSRPPSTGPRPARFFFHFSLCACLYFVRAQNFYFNLNFPFHFSMNCLNFSNFTSACLLIHSNILNVNGERYQIKFSYDPLRGKLNAAGVSTDDDGWKSKWKAQAACQWVKWELNW